MHHFGPTEYTQENENEHLVVKEVKDGFVFGGHYEVSVSAESFGIFHSKSAVFGEFDINTVHTISTIGCLFLNHVDAVFDHDSCKPSTGMFMLFYMHLV